MDQTPKTLDPELLIISYKRVILKPLSNSTPPVCNAALQNLQSPSPNQDYSSDVTTRQVTAVVHHRYYLLSSAAHNYSIHFDV